MRLTLSPKVNYTLRICKTRATATVDNPRNGANFGTMVTWSEAAPGDRRPKAGMQTWYESIVRQPGICAIVPVTPYGLVSRDVVPVGFSSKAQIGWVYCMWGKARARFKGTDYQIQRAAEWAIIREAQLYADYVTGNVYDYILLAHKQPVRWGGLGHWQPRVVARGRGFLGSDPEHNGMVEALPSYFREVYYAYNMHVIIGPETY